MIAAPTTPIRISYLDSEHPVLYPYFNESAFNAYVLKGKRTIKDDESNVTSDIQMNHFENALRQRMFTLVVGKVPDQDVGTVYSLSKSKRFEYDDLMANPITRACIKACLLEWTPDKGRSWNARVALNDQEHRNVRMCLIRIPIAFRLAVHVSIDRVPNQPVDVATE